MHTDDADLNPVRPLHCVVTGATRGIGRAVAAELARRGCAIVVLGRDSDAGERVLVELRQLGAAPMSFVRVDLSAQRDVRAAAAQLLAAHDRIDVLVNNAGIYTFRPARSEDGIELNAAVNHLAPFLLTRLLLPALGAAPVARVINVTSRVERFALTMGDWAAPPALGGVAGLLPYARSKRAMLHVTRELAHRLRDTAIRVNSVHPGFVATDLLRQLPAFVRRAYAPLLTTPEESARTIADLAMSPDYVTYSGAYFHPGPRLARSSRPSYSVEERRAVWRRSCELAGLPVDL